MILILLGTKLVLWPLFDRVVFFCTSCMLLVAKLGRYLQKLTRFASAHISRAWLLRPAAVCIVYKVGQGEVGLVEFKACCASRENNASGRQPCLLPFVQQYFRTNTETSGNYEFFTILRPVQSRYIWTTHIENAELSLVQVVKQYFCSVMYTKYKYKYMADFYFLPIRPHLIVRRAPQLVWIIINHFLLTRC